MRCVSASTLFAVLLALLMVFHLWMKLELFIAEVHLLGTAYDAAHRYLVTYWGYPGNLVGIQARQAYVGQQQNNQGIIFDMRNYWLGF